MRPKQPEAEPRDDLFRARLENLVDPRHALARLAGLIDWGRFEAEFGALYTDGGRPGLPTRLMVGLHLLKHMDGLSDEAVCARYLDSPYAQLFCGETFFQHALPLDRSSMTRWRRRIGPERLELLLAESLAAAQRGGAVEERHLRRVTIDTTVQPKAVTHPTDSKLLQRGIEILARLARRNGVRLRQSYLRVARKARREAAKLIHSGRPRQAERQVRRLRTWLGRLFRDIGRKIAGNAAAESAFAGPLGLIARLLRQRREDRGRDKLCSCDCESPRMCEPNSPQADATAWPAGRAAADVHDVLLGWGMDDGGSELCGILGDGVIRRRSALACRRPRRRHGR